MESRGETESDQVESWAVGGTLHQINPVKENKMGRLQRIIWINQRLAQIANLTGQMALKGTANPSNPDFVALMDEQAKLIAEQFELLDQELRDRLP